MSEETIIGPDDPADYTCVLVKPKQPRQRTTKWTTTIEIPMRTKTKITKAQRAARNKACLEYKNRRINKGLCGTCGKPSDRPGYPCKSCREKQRDYMFKKYRIEHDIPLNWPRCTPGRPKIEAMKVPVEND